MIEKESVNPNGSYGPCSCGNPRYKKVLYCSTCDTLWNQGKIKEVLGRLSLNVDILTGRIYRNRSVEDLF